MKVIRRPWEAIGLFAGRLRQSGLGIHYRDAVNRWRFGDDGPLYGERIWINPQQCTTSLDRSIRLGPDPRSLSGQVAGGDWDLDVRSINEIDKVRFALAHWRDGLPWDETGAYEHMMDRITAAGRAVDRCLTLDDVIARYRRLDEIFEEVRRDGRLRSRAELSASAFRERKGIYIHVGRDLDPIFGGGSNNRLAMALVLELPVVPAQVGRVHRRAVPNWREVYGSRIDRM